VHIFLSLQVNSFKLIPKFVAWNEDYEDQDCLIRFNFLAYCLRDAPKSLTVNNCTLCPHCIYVFGIYLRTNNDLCHLRHKLIGFYNRDSKCLQRGTDWVFKLIKGLKQFLYAK